MSVRLAPWAAVAAYVAVAAVVAWALRPIAVPTAPQLVAAILAGGLLFVAFSGGAAFRRPRRSPVLLALAALIALGAAAEEVVWRLGLLGLLTRRVPDLAALLCVSVLFGLAHVRTQGLRGGAVHLGSGWVFGALYLFAGGVLAAAAAHVAYNLLVACAPTGDSSGAPSPARAWTPVQRRREVSAGLPVTTLRGVRKRLGEALVLDGVDLEVRAGEILCLLGPNGAGKSTAVSLVTGLRRPDEGSVRLFGRNPRDPAARRLLGVTQQEAAFPVTLRVREIVSLAAAHFDAPEPTGQLLRRFGLADLAGRQAGGLSGGERRRLAVALALVGRPELVVLDEPTVGLDVEVRRAVWHEVSTFAERGGSVLFTTHYLEEAESVATAIVLLADGRVAARGSVPEIRARVGLTRVAIPDQPLPPLPTVVRRESSRGRTVVLVRDPEAVLHALAVAGADLGGIEVRPVSLEELLLSLTGDDSQ